MPTNVEFDEINHRYTVDGETFVPVTTVLNRVLKVESPFWKPEHRLRGSMVHKIIEAINENDWDPEAVAVPPGWTEETKRGIVGRGQAYLRFVEENGFEPVASEVRLHSTVHRLAGTADVIGWARKGQFKDELLLVDGKSGAPTPAAILQLALYDECWRETMWDPSLLLPPITAHVILQVKENGAPRPAYRFGHQLQQDMIDSLSVMNVYRFLERNGML